MRNLLAVISLPLLAGLILAGQALPGFADNGSLGANGAILSRTRALIHGADAYVAGPPELVSDGLIGQIALSPDGKSALISVTRRHPFRHVLLTKEDVPPIDPEVDLLYWDSRTRTTATLYREPIPSGSPTLIEQLAWLPGTRTGLAVIRRSTSGPEGTASRTLLRIDPATGAAHRLTDLAPEESLNISPTQPIAYIQAADDHDGAPGPAFSTTLRVLTPEGFHPAPKVPDGLSALRWTEDGAHLFCAYSLERTEEKRLVKHDGVTVIDLRTGEVTHPTTAPTASPKGKYAPLPTEADSLRLTTRAAILKDTDAAHGETPTSAVWLEGGDPVPPTSGGVSALLIAPDARAAALLPDDSAALFYREGALYAAPIFRLDAVAFAQALREAQRNATIANIKQVGLALIGFIQDNDLRFPDKSDDLQKTLSPYLLNNSVFQNPATGENGFTFTYNGPASEAQITDIANTELGYLNGPGGRAVLYADGHVRWKDD